MTHSIIYLIGITQFTSNVNINITKASLLMKRNEKK